LGGDGRGERGDEVGAGISVGRRGEKNVWVATIRNAFVENGYGASCGCGGSGGLKWCAGDAQDLALVQQDEWEDWEWGVRIT